MIKNPEYSTLVCMRKSVEGFNYELLKDAIEQSGLRTDFLANKAGIQPVTLSRYIHGRKRPSLPTLILIAQALGRDVSDFCDQRTA